MYVAFSIFCFVLLILIFFKFIFNNFNFYSVYYVIIASMFSAYVANELDHIITIAHIIQSEVTIGGLCYWGRIYTPVC